MAKSCLIDIFDLCWDAILKESVDYSNTFFNEKHCLVDESRDTNFDLVENRLAYMYKFGCFNTILVQKCLESFLDKYSEVEELFSRDLKVCSLSNGPGLDIIGLLCGIYKSNPNLKSLLVFKAVNLYSSWWNICHSIFTKVFQVLKESSNSSFCIPPEIIHFMQCDIYSSLSSDVEECIKDSDLLLMVRVFASTKATPDVVIKSMKEIFSLLKPRSLVFFVGSKKNTKELATNNVLNEFVDCVLNPIKISLTDLPINEAVVKSVSVKPKTSGYAYFVVWQKKDSILLDNVPKNVSKKKRSKKKKSTIHVQNKSIESTAVLKETDDNDESSDTLCSSHSKQSESLSDGFRSASCENMFQPNLLDQMHLQKEELNKTLKKSLSVDSIATLLGKINLDSKKGDLTAIKDITKLREVNISIPDKHSEAGELESCIVKEVVTQTKNEDGLLNEINSSISMPTIGKVLNQVSYKPESQLMQENNSCEKPNMKPLLTYSSKELHLIGKNVFPVKENSTFNLDNRIQYRVHLNSSNEKQSVQAIQLNTNVSSIDSIFKLKKISQAKKSGTHVVTQTEICSQSNILQDKSKTNVNQVTDSLNVEEDICDKASSSNSSSRKSSVNNLQGGMFRTVTKNTDDIKSHTNPNIASIKNKERLRILENKSCENSLKEITPGLNDRSKDFNLLLQHCENLVESLEKLIANVKNSISLSNEQDTLCCFTKSCTKFKTQYACVNSCCHNHVHSHCCRKVCNCPMFHHNTCSKNFC